MNELMKNLERYDARNDKAISIGNIKISLINYLYLSMIKTWIGDDSTDFNRLIDSIILSFLNEHKEDIKALKEENKKDNSDWLVDTLFGE